jgi:Protein of unknown function (DUF2934)
MTQISTDEIAKRAYEIWEADGCLHGRDVDYWLLAEAQLVATAAPKVTGGQTSETPAAEPSAPKKP